MEISEIELIQTCVACPEQYDAYHNNIQVGYLRLRHGFFYVDCPDCGDETVYTANPKGDGIFYEDEREFYLNGAKQAIINHYNEKKAD